MLGEPGDREEKCPVEELLSFVSNSEGDSLILLPHLFFFYCSLTSKTDFELAEGWPEQNVKVSLENVFP